MIKDIHGSYEISNGVTAHDLEKIVIDPKAWKIDFSNTWSEKEILLLESVVFSKRPDILLVVGGNHGDLCDLSLIQKLSSVRKLSIHGLMDIKGIEAITQLEKLECLSIGAYALQDFDFLHKINPYLKHLSLYQTQSKKPRIEALGRFEQLEYLLLEGQQKGIEAVSSLKQLKQIVLRSISTKDVDYLKNLEHLWSVDIKLGGIKDFTGLTALPSIKYLELWQVLGLADLSFISDLKTLQNLFIQSLRHLSKLPDFSNNINLRRIYFENLKGLKDLSSLKKVPNLKDFIYVLAQNQEPEDILSVLENPSVKKVFCRFGSDRKNNRFDELAKQYNKSEYVYRKFKYK